MINNEYEDFSDDDTSYYNIMYDPEEISLTRFNIVLCELYNNKIHGTPSPNSNIEYHYLTINRYKNLDSNKINELAEFVNTEYNNLLYLLVSQHSIFRNYLNIVRQENYIKPEIAECIYLPTGECVSIIKTFWIRLIQKKWKKIYKERQKIFNRRLSMQSLKYRELNGTWPPSCLHYPSIKGMLS